MDLSPKEMVADYFHFVDTENLSSILNLMTEDFSFTIETHGITLPGFEEISVMFKRLWDNYEWVKHDQFEWVEGRLDQDIAVRFRVTNKLHDGTLVNKSNCNFFTLRNGLFSAVRVYLAGANTLNIHCQCPRDTTILCGIKRIVRLCNNQRCNLGCT